MNIHAVMLCAGKGSRFNEESEEGYKIKQLQKLPDSTVLERATGGLVALFGINSVTYTLTEEHLHAYMPFFEKIRDEFRVKVSYMLMDPEQQIESSLGKEITRVKMLEEGAIDLEGSRVEFSPDTRVLFGYGDAAVLDLNKFQEKDFKKLRALVEGMFHVYGSVRLDGDDFDPEIENCLGTIFKLGEKPTSPGELDVHVLVANINEPQDLRDARNYWYENISSIIWYVDLKRARMDIDPEKH